MRIGIRGKLFLLTVIAVLAVELAAGLYLERELRLSLDNRIENELLLHAQSARDLFEVNETELEIDSIDPLTDRLGGSTDARVTVIAIDGTVLGDSELSVSEVEAVDNHATRPEILEAQDVGTGTSRRYSNTIRTDMLYVAVAFDHGTVRVSKPLQEVDAAIQRLRVVLALAGVLALALAGFVAGLLSHFVSGRLRTLVDAAHAMAEPSGTPTRLPVSSSDEIGGLAGSFNRMAEDLEETVSALADERNRFETVLESMDEAVLAIDSGDRVTTINGAAREMLGLSSKLGPKPTLDLIRVPELAELVGHAREGRPCDLEIELIDRGRRRVLARATPQAGGGAVLVMHDVTEIRRLETVRRDFVANVSHELRTPVSIIRANAETLLEGGLADSDDSRRFLEAMLRHADRLGRLVADLLDISRIEAGKYQMNPKAVKMAPIVRRVLEVVDAKAEAKGMSIELDVPEEVEAYVDPKALEQVLVNLVENAVKYTPEEGHVEVAAVPGKSQLRLEVRDNGPGIDPKHRARIFERFYRVDPGRSRDMGGTGLGLSIVRHLIEAMGGQVGVEGREPHGSLFWVSVPRQAA